MENYYGKDSWLIEKYGDVNFASRSKIIKGTNQLLNENSKPLSYYKHQLQQVNLLNLECSKRHQALHKLGLSRKSVQNVQKEAFKHKILRELNSQGGPFTSSEEVQENLVNTKDIEKDVQSRLKKEVQYAKYTANKIEKTNSLFKLMNIQENKKRKLKSIQELSENLKIYFGKTSDQNDEQIDTLTKFKEELSKKKQN